MPTTGLSPLDYQLMFGASANPAMQGAMPDPHFQSRTLEQQRKASTTAAMGFPMPAGQQEPSKASWLDRAMGGVLGAPNTYGVLGDDDLADARRRAMLAMGASLLAGSGPSPVKRGTGELIGNALMTGQSAQDQATQSSLQTLLLKQKLNETPKSKRYVVNGALVDEDGTPLYTSPSAPKPMDPLSKLSADYEAGLLSDEDYAARRKAIIEGRPLTQVNVNTDKSLYGTLAEKQAGQYSDLYSQAQTAPERIVRAQRVRAALEQGAYTGATANFKLAFGKAARELGYNVGTEVENTEALAADLAASTLEAIKSSGLGGGTGFSNADRDFLERVTGGKITLEAETLRRLADLNERAARVTVQRWNSTAQRLKPEFLDQLGMGVVQEGGNNMGNGWSIEPVQ